MIMMGDGGSYTGAMYVIFLKTNANAKSAQKISYSYGNLNAFYTIDANDRLCGSLAVLGDIDGDCVVDIAAGTYADDDGAENAGAMYLLFLKQVVTLTELKRYPTSMVT